MLSCPVGISRAWPLNFFMSWTFRELRPTVYIRCQVPRPIIIGSHKSCRGQSALGDMGFSVRVMVVDTARVRQGLCDGTVSVRMSVCLCVPSIDHCSSVRRVCCFGLCRQEISIDCCTARLLQQARPPLDPYLRRGG